MVDVEDFELGYQCKQCPERFTTTVAFQRHKRLIHRAGASASSSGSGLSSPRSKSSKSASVQVKKELIGEAELELNEGVSGEINSTPSGRHKACESCHYRFDTRDPVIAHLLKLCRRENNGPLTCPFCVQVEIDPVDGASAAASPASGSPRSSRTSRAKGGIRSNPMRLCELRRSSRGTPTPSPSSSPVVAQKQQQEKRKEPRPLKHKLKETLPMSEVVQSINLALEGKKWEQRQSPSKKSTPSRTILAQASTSPPAVGVLQSSSNFNSTATTVVSASESAPILWPQSEWTKPSYELLATMNAIPNPMPNLGEGERGIDQSGSGTRTTDETTIAVTATAAATNSDNYYYEPSLGVPVLINHTPVESTSSRLAVPKLSDFGHNVKGKEGNFPCKHCNFVGDSFKALQSHVNTHLAKSFPCEFCPNIYRSFQAVMKHGTRHHPKEMQGKKYFSKKERKGVGVGIQASDEDSQSQTQSLSNLSSTSSATGGDSIDGGGSDSFSNFNQNNSNLEDSSSRMRMQYSLMVASSTDSVPSDRDPLAPDEDEEAQYESQQEEHREFAMFAKRNDEDNKYIVENVVDMDNF